MVKGTCCCQKKERRKEYAASAIFSMKKENDAERDKWYSHVLYSFGSHHFCLDSTFQKEDIRMKTSNISFLYIFLLRVDALRMCFGVCVCLCAYKRDAFEFQFTIYLTSAAMKANRPLGDQTWVTINVEFESGINSSGNGCRRNKTSLGIYACGRVCLCVCVCPLWSVLYKFN